MTTRIRSSDLTSITAHSRTTSFCIAANSVVPTMGARAGEWKWMADVLTPNFKKRSNAGEIIINTMARKVHSFSSVTTGYGHSVSRSFCPTPPGDGPISDSFTSLLHWKLGPAGYGENFVPPDLIPAGTRSSASTLAATAALADWKSASVQSMVFLAELRKTVKTLLNPVQALTQEIARGRKRGWTMKGGLRGASGEYLTWFYGIRSLMFDIEGAQEALKRMSTCKRETGRGKQEVLVENVSSNLVLHLGSTLKDSRYRIDTKHTHVCRAGLVGDVEMGVDSSRGFGYRLSDIPGTLWELMPWSFVLDWAVNLGDYIESLFTDVVTGVKGQWITTIDTVEVKRTVTSTTLAVATPQWSIHQSCSDQDTATYLTKSRVPVNLADYRGLSIRTGFDRVPELAALALVIQQLTKR